MKTGTATISYTALGRGMTEITVGIDGEKASANVTAMVLLEGEMPEVNASAITAGKPGDVNADDTIDIMDVIALNKYLLGSAKLDDAAKANADVDQSGEIDSTDSLNILKYVVELIDSFDAL